MCIGVESFLSVLNYVELYYTCLTNNFIFVQNCAQTKPGYLNCIM